MSRTVQDMTADMIRACALRCPLKLPGGNGVVRVNAATGDWFAYPAKSEPVKRWRKVCIDDLRQRELRGGSYPGDVGHCVIGGKRFSLYPRSGMLVRDDFALWAEAHIDECWDFHLHRERLPEKDPTGEEIAQDTIQELSHKSRMRARKLLEVTDLLAPGTWNSLYDMKKAMAEYAVEIRRDEVNGRFYVGSKILADHLAANIAYRSKKYADCIDFLLSLSAAALKAAQFVQEKAAKEVK